MRKKLAGMILILSLAAAVFAPAAVFAAESGAAAQSSAGGSAQSVQANASAKAYWKLQNGRYYYFSADNKKSTGLTVIDGKKYFFDAAGVQCVGWQKIGSAYYYFQIAKSKWAYMISGKTVNHIKLGRDGKAKVNAGNSQRLKVLVIAQLEVQKATKKNTSMPRYQKLQTVWKYFLKHYPYIDSPDYRYVSGWEVKNARFCFVDGNGDCMAQGAAFAFLANACGYKKVNSVSSGGHGWAEVNGHVFDPTWAKVDRNHSYFNMKMSLSGKAGRPLYKSSRLHVYRI